MVDPTASKCFPWVEVRIDFASDAPQIVRALPVSTTRARLNPKDQLALLRSGDGGSPGGAVRWLHPGPPLSHRPSLGPFAECGQGGFRREVQPRRQHWFLNEKSGSHSERRLLLGFQGTKTARREGISSPFSDAGGCTSPQNSGRALIRSWKSRSLPPQFKRPM